MLYCARLVLCICLFTFQPMSRDSLMSIYTHWPPLFSSSFRIFVNRCCLVYQQPNTKARFFWLHFVVYVFFCFTFVFHIPTVSCWLTVSLSVVQILIFHVCSFFLTYTSCIQRLYKGQFKILQSYFAFIIKCHWRRNTKYSTLLEYMCTYGRSIVPAIGLFYISCRCTYKSISLCIFNLNVFFDCFSNT